MFRRLVSDLAGNRRRLLPRLLDQQAICAGNDCLPVVAQRLAVRKQI